MKNLIALRLALIITYTTLILFPLVGSASTPYVSDLPDLTMVDIKVFPTPPVINNIATFNKGTEYRIEVYIKNEGKRSAITTVNMRWGLSSYDTLNWPIIWPGKIGVGKTQKAIFYWTPRKLGYNKVMFRVDPSNIVRESNENNNIWSSTVRVRNRPRTGHG